MFPAAACRSSSPALRAFAPSAARSAPLISTGVWLTKLTFCKINDPRPFFGRDGDRCLIKIPRLFSKEPGYFAVAMSLIGVRQCLEPRQRPFDHFRLDAIGDPEVAGSTEAAAGDQQQVDFFGSLAERHVIRFQ